MAERVLLYTGKGGVGKTTCAAATALRCAELGFRTVVLSTDAAHSLGDSFDRPLGPEPVAIAPNLWGQEADVYYNLQRHWSKVQAWLTALFAWRGVNEILAEEMAILPGMEELSNLLWINLHHRQDEFDVVVVDCAPTGETLRLLAFPEDLYWWVERLLPVERRLARVINPIVSSVTGMPTPDDRVFDQGEEIVQQLAQLRALLGDLSRTSLRLVLNPERMVIKEAQRTFTYFNLYGYGTDAIICNRVLPPAVEDAYFSAWQRQQQEHLAFITEAFSPLPIRTVPLMEQEVTGLEMLRRVADELFGDENPITLYYRGPTHSVHKMDGGYALELRLPFSQKGNIEVLKRGDELMVRIGAYRRSIVLPTVLARLSPGGAKLEEDVLRIAFREGAER